MRHHMRLTTGAPALMLLLLEAALVAHGYESYQAKIPNGHRIPNPCNPGSLWPGVGHWRAAGDGPRNPFGKAFDHNKLVWNEALCKLDSDGDGRTNGEELGDPDCVWTEGAPPARTDQLSHPGVCEPVTADHCRKQNGHSIPCGSMSLRSSLDVLCALLLTAVAAARMLL